MAGSVKGGVARALACVFICSALAACGHDHAREEVAADRAPTATAQHLQIQAGSLMRSYVFYAPSRLSKGAALVIVLHDSDQDGAGIERTTGFAFDRLADRNGFAVAYPDAYEGNWNDCRKAVNTSAKRIHADDKLLVRNIIARAVQEHGIDPHKVFAVGHANGGQMVYRLALEQPGDMAGVAVISADLPAPENMDCAATREPMPVMIINGTEDPLNPYRGGHASAFLGLGDSGALLSAEDSAAYFERLDHQVGAAQTSRLAHQDPADPTWVEQEAWASPDTTPVTLITIHGGGHVVPQPYNRYPMILGRQTKDLDAPAAVWEFFAHIAGIELR